MPLNAAIQRIQRLMGSTAFLTDGAGGGAQTKLSNLLGPRMWLNARKVEDETSPVFARKHPVGKVECLAFQRAIPRLLNPTTRPSGPPTWNPGRRPCLSRSRMSNRPYVPSGAAAAKTPATPTHGQRALPLSSTACSARTSPSTILRHPSPAGHPLLSGPPTDTYSAYGWKGRDILEE